MDRVIINKYIDKTPVLQIADIQEVVSKQPARILGNKIEKIKVVNAAFQEAQKRILEDLKILEGKLSLINKGFEDIQTNTNKLTGISGNDKALVTMLYQTIYMLEDISVAIEDYTSSLKVILEGFKINSKIIRYNAPTLQLIEDLQKNEVLLESRRNVFEKIVKEIQKKLAVLNVGRMQLSASNPVDWDDTPTLYQNTSIGLGHILIYKQIWKNDGYSIGDVEGSIVLQPMQMKHVATVDWTRTDTATRSEEIENREELVNTVTRDSDTQEILKTAFGETLSGNSKSSSKSKGGSVGATVVGSFFGISGGYQSNSSSASSSSSQNSSRNLASSAAQMLKDKVQQSAASVRSQRNTVIQSVSQTENVSTSTEVIVNYNRRHALTTMWFSINRHFVIEQELVDVQECLFFPLPMAEFDVKKIYRWKDVLEENLLDSTHHKAFEAIDRIVDKYENVNFPAKRYCDEPIEYIEGEILVSFEIPRIPDPDETELEAAIESRDSEKIKQAIQANENKVLLLYDPYFMLFRRVFPHRQDIYLNKLKKEAKEKRDYVYEKEVVPVMVDTIVDEYLKILVNDSQIPLEDVDFTLVDKYEDLVRPARNGSFVPARGRALRAKFRIPKVDMTRDEIKQLKIRIQPDDNEVLPDGVRILVHSANIVYHTAYGRYTLYAHSNIKDELKCKKNEGSNTRIFDDAVWKTERKTFLELQEPRKDDLMKASRLIAHLNQHIERYHNIIWMNMDTGRLFAMMDGYIAPNSNGRSVASVVEPQPLGVIGNNLILKVVPGANLDPAFHLNNADGKRLLDHYKPDKPLDPYRITIKNPGLYGESILGKCESAETIDDSKLWRNEDLVIPYLAPEIQQGALNSRYQSPGNLQVKDLAQPLINMQTLTPDTLNDSAMKDALTLIGKSDVFRDATGLAGTQKLVENGQNQNTQILKNATDAANIALQTGTKFNLDKQKQDLEAYKEFSKNATPEEKKKLQQALMESWGNNSKALENSIENATAAARKQVEAQAEKNPNNTLQQVIDSAKPGTSIEAVVNADGSADLKMVKGETSSDKWVRNDSERLLQIAQSYGLYQVGKPDKDKVCWAYALALTMFPVVNVKSGSTSEEVIEQVLTMSKEVESDHSHDDEDEEDFGNLDSDDTHDEETGE